MNILLDTHIYIWWLKDDRHLSKKARTIIANADTVYVSSVSIWESIIKMQLGKLEILVSDLIAAIENEGFIELPLTIKHAAKLAELPNYHRDPFDRTLVAQAITEPLRLITVDAALKPYSELVEMV